jgi:hypothetical protein
MVSRKWYYAELLLGKFQNEMAKFFVVAIAFFCFSVGTKV